MTKSEQIRRVWLRYPQRWQHLSDLCQRGEGRYSRGVFILAKKKAAPPRPRSVPQMMAEMLKSQPLGYLS